ncbi:MAG: hypothetical protein DHS20C18_38110 [Saprospiraceae bacterium]|nr:MAG: hypothetical protein DHS20C18_38110 [Saprospiraceae bacterium]
MEVALKNKDYRRAFEQLESAEGYPKKDPTIISELRKRLFYLIENEKDEAKRQKERADINAKNAGEAALTAEKERNRAEIEAKKARQSANASFNSATISKISRADPTLALSMAKYTIKKYPNEPSAYIGLQNLLGNSDNHYYTFSEKMHEDAIWDFVVSWSRDVIITISRDKKIKVIDPLNNSVRTLGTHQGGVTAISTSRDDNYFITGSEDSTALIWNFDLEVIKSFRHGGELTSVDISPNNQYVLTAGRDSLCTVWTFDGEFIASYRQEDNVSSAIFVDNDRILSSCYGPNSNLALWDFKKNAKKILDGHTHYVRDMAVSTNGQYIITGSDDQTAILWGLDLNMVRIFRGHQGGINGVNFHPETNDILTCSDDGSVKVWSLNGEEKATLLGHDQAVWAASFMNSLPIIVSSDFEGFVKSWAFREDEKRIDFNEGLSIALANKDELFFVGSGSNTQPKGKIIDFEGNDVATLVGSQFPITEATFFDQDSKIITTDGFFLRIWDLSGNPIDKFNAPESVQFIYHLRAMEKDSTFLISGLSFSSPDQGKKAYLVDWEGKVLSTFDHGAMIGDLSFSEDENFILTGGVDGKVIIWDKNGTVNQTIDFGKKGISSIKISKDQNLLLTGFKDGIIKLYDLESNSSTNFIGHLKEVTTLFFDLAEQYVYSGSWDGTAKVWTLDGHELFDLTRQLRAVNLLELRNDTLTIGFLDGSLILKRNPLELMSSEVYVHSIPEMLKKGLIVEESEIDTISDIDAIQEIADYYYDTDSWDKAISLYEKLVRDSQSVENLYRFYRVTKELKGKFDLKYFTNQEDLSTLLPIFLSVALYRDFETSDLLIKDLLNKSNAEQQKIFLNIIDQNNVFPIRENHKENAKFLSYLTQISESIYDADVNLENMNRYAAHLYSKAWEELLSGNIKAAEETTQRGLTIQKDNVYHHKNQISILILKGQMDKALNLFNEFESMPFDEKNGLPLFRDAILKDFIQFMEESLLDENQLKDFEKIIALIITEDNLNSRSLNIEALFQYYELSRESGVSFNSTYFISQEDTKSLMFLFIGTARLKDWDLADTLFRKLYDKLDLNDREILLNFLFEKTNFFSEKGHTHFESSKYFGYASSLYESIYTYNPTKENAGFYLQILNSVGWHQLLAGEFSMAEQTIRKGLKTDENNVYLIGNLAAILLLKGDYEKAYEMYDHYKAKPFDLERGIPTFREAFIDDLKVFSDEGVIPKERADQVKQIMTLLEE